jgi:hypothetical protein
MGTKQGASSPAERFRTNLRTRIRSKGITQKEAAEKIGIKYQRLRKLCGQGLARIPTKDSEDLRKICRFFGIKRTRLLWSSTVNTDRPPKYSEGELDAYIETLAWVWGKFPKLRQLRTAMKWIDRASKAAIEMLAPEPEDEGELDMDIGIRDRIDFGERWGTNSTKNERRECYSSRFAKDNDD